ncbi:MAG: prolipoprotein diacylglyceryl transferase [Deltaproteobacteria bacterium]|nr:prolipoprotein diacylglyceryl transferase [Deltaproteobacteria bacterium]MCX7953020.1 prolipoprotein diacylglyceryl transferase [Deltaproteobacteria bacterium]
MFVYLVEIGGYGVPIFGFIVALAFLGSVEVFKTRVAPTLSYKTAETLAVSTIVVGLLGAKVWFELFYSPKPFETFFLPAGIVFHGGFIFGLIYFTVWCWIKKIPTAAAFNPASMAVLFGYAVGRLGCQLSGDGDYGLPTTFWLSMKYPSGVVPTSDTVYPTPVFESLFCMAWFILANRFFKDQDNLKPTGFVLIGLAFERFFIEFIRRNKPVIFNLTDAQIFSVALFVIGTTLILKKTLR